MKKEKTFLFQVIFIFHSYFELYCISLSMMVFRMYPPSFHEYSVSLCAHCRLGKITTRTTTVPRGCWGGTEKVRNCQRILRRRNEHLLLLAAASTADYSLFFSCFRTFTSITVVVLQLQTCKVHSRMCGKKSKNFTSLSFNQTDLPFKIHLLTLLLISSIVEYFLKSCSRCFLSSKINSLWLTFRRCLCKTVSTVVSSTYLLALML